MTAGPPWSPAWCRLIGEGELKTPNGGTVLPIANLMADSESGSPSSYSSFLVTTSLSRLVLEMFACYRQTDNENHYYSWPPPIMLGQRGAVFTVQLIGVGELKTPKMAERYVLQTDGWINRQREPLL